MTLEELKNSDLSVAERAQSVVSSLGLTGDERSIVVGLKKGDTFQLVAMNKMELSNNQQREGQTKFVPITFTTEKGASIGAKHFIDIEIDDNAPAVGLTPLENANFLVWCIDHEVTFKVKKVTEQEIEAKNGVPGYTKRIYELGVEDYNK